MTVVSTEKNFRLDAPNVGRRIVDAPSAAPRVRTAARFDARWTFGGGEIQMSATSQALVESGVDCRPWRPWEDDLRQGDVLHLFGSRREFLPLIDAAHQRGARVALSTIAWFDWRSILREADSIAYRTWATFRYAARVACPRTASWRRTLYQAADLLLPNSQAEAEQLMRLFQVPAAKIRVVPNGAEPRFARATPARFIAKYCLDDFVFSPGRIEPRKNQLQLIRACRDLRMPLVIVGDAVPGHEDYLEACRREAGDDVHFLGRLDHDDPLLASAYAAAACTALVGWYETPGLAALEAAMTGTPLVLPRGGCAREYFGPWAEYVDPHDAAGIRNAIATAVRTGRRAELAALAKEQFTWRRTAEATREAYATLG